MPKNSTLNLGTGAFVALGFAALFFLTTRHQPRPAFGSPPHYDLTAKFDNIGDLRVVRRCRWRAWRSAGS